MEETIQETLKRARSNTTNYANACKKLKNTKKINEMEHAIKLLITLIYPQLITDCPDKLTNDKISVFVDTLTSKKRTLFVQQIKQFEVHKNILLLFENVQFTTEKLFFYEKVNDLLQIKTTKILFHDACIFLLEYRRRLKYPMKDITLTNMGDIKLKDAAKFCFVFHRKNMLRINLLLSTGFLFSSQELLQKITKYELYYTEFLKLKQTKISEHVFFDLIDTFGNIENMINTTDCSDIINKLLILPCKQKAFQLLLCILKINNRHEMILNLQKNAPFSLSLLTNTQRYQLFSEWHQSIYKNMMRLVTLESQRSSSFRERYIKNTSSHFCRFMLFLDQYACCNLQIFLRELKFQDLETMIRAYVTKTQSHNDKVKTTRKIHQGAHVVSQTLRFLRVYLKNHIGCEQELHKINTTSILMGIENTRIPADAMTRRTFTNEEVDAMIAVARGPAEMLLIHLLREVALRQSALSCMKYEMLLTSNHEPLKQCKIPEKGNKLRCFVLSENLQTKIKDLSQFLRSQYTDAELIGCYLLNANNIRVPAPIYDTVIRLAKDANINNVKVHPHAFRHTLVGALVAAGNKLEDVSKFMGHDKVSTTSYFYWLPTSEQLNENVINPFINSYNQNEKEHPVLLHVANAKVSACRKIIDILMQELDFECKNELLCKMPDINEIIEAIDSPSGVSLSDDKSVHSNDFYQDDNFF